MSTSLYQRRPDERTKANAEVVLETLSDSVCRRILTVLKAADTPRTASDLSETCDVPLSTLYRKLELLTEASLVEETIQLRHAGKHTCQYETDFDGVQVRLTDDDEFEVVFGDCV